MKSRIKIFSLLICMQILACISPQKAFAQNVSVSFQVFYDDLSPYGTWVNSPQYGYVWIPSVDDGFAPYDTNGYWILTDAGWTWVSNYPWGWAPFHYGRWYMDPFYGAVWVPGSEWGPGWVVWRQSQGYYGWAPIGPGVSIDVAYSSHYDVPHSHWRFVRDRDFGSPNIHNHYVNRTNNVTIINNSTVINNTYVDGKRNSKYHAGPGKADVEKRAGRAFSPAVIKENNKPGQAVAKDEVKLYRPSIQPNKNTAPAKVVDMKDLKARDKANTPSQKTSPGTQGQRAKPNQKKVPNERPLPTDNKKQPEPIIPKGNNEPQRQQQVPADKPDQPVKPEHMPSQRRAEPNQKPVPQQKPIPQNNVPPPERPRENSPPKPNGTRSPNEHKGKQPPH